MDRLLKITDITSLTGFKRAWIYELIRRDEFPRQVKIGKRAVRWRESEVEEWMESRPKAIWSPNHE